VRYILYDVNPGEGFNLRRDVFMRVAIFVRKMNEDSEDTFWKLVLPPWGHLYHWQSRSLGHQTRIPWSMFFDVDSINKFVPVLELTDFLSKEGTTIDSVYYLQGYKEGWKDGKFEEKHDLRDCLESPRYKLIDGEYFGRFWDFQDVSAKNFACLSVQGHASSLAPFVTDLPAKSIMLDRAENVLHDWFGDVNYWGARRSMRFAKHLVDIADDYRADFLDSYDKKDNTVVSQDWRSHKAERIARGGPFACVHLRRKDYVYSRKDQIPSIQGAAKQLLKKLGERKLTTLFVATDAPYDEFNELVKLMDPDVAVLKYMPENDILKTYKDGGVAIIDQIICSHARYFIGSYESTFTFRIQEERELMGFPLKDTFEMLCADGLEDCEKGSQWKVDWGDKDTEWKVQEVEVKKHTEL